MWALPSQALCGGCCDFCNEWEEARVLGIRKFTDNEVREGLCFHNALCPCLCRIPCEIDGDAERLSARGVIELQERIDAVELIERSADGGVHAYPIELILRNIECLNDGEAKFPRELLFRVRRIPRLKIFCEPNTIFE